MDAILKKVLARIESQDKRLAAIESTITKLSVVVTKISDDGNTQRGLVQALNNSLAKIKTQLAEDDTVEEATEQVATEANNDSSLFGSDDEAGEIVTDEPAAETTLFGDDDGEEDEPVVAEEPTTGSSLFGDDDDEDQAAPKSEEQQEKSASNSLFGDDDDSEEAEEDGNLFGSDDEPAPAPAAPTAPKRRTNFDIMMEFYSEVAPEKAQAEGITKALTVFKDTLPKMCAILTKKYGRAPVLNQSADESEAQPPAAAPAPELFVEDSASPGLFDNDDDDDDDDDDHYADNDKPKSSKVSNSLFGSDDDDDDDDGGLFG